jgi:ATP-dependent helicase Lhr and Lhr-like helicase
VTPADGRQRWWTFAGQHANTGLAQALRANGMRVQRLDNFSIGLTPSVDVVALEVLRELASVAFRSPVDDRAIEGLKFNECLPEEVAREALGRRLTDTAGVKCLLGQPVESVVVHTDHTD